MILVAKLFVMGMSWVIGLLLLITFIQYVMEHEFQANEVCPVPPGLLPFRVIMDRNGNTSEGEVQIGCYGETNIPFKRASLQRALWNEGDGGYTRFTHIDATVFADCKEGAIKIVNELRARVIASGVWDEFDKPGHDHPFSLDLQPD